MPLTPTGTNIGESIGSSLLDAAGYLTSGEKLAGAFAPRLRKSTIPGVARLTNVIGDAYEAAPAPVRFLADNLLSPIGLAATILAPVTGGASLGASGALGTAARLSTRLAAEAAVAGGASLAAKGAQKLVPEDAPWWAQAGVPILAGLAGGVGTAGAVKSVIREATPAVARSLVVEKSRAQGLRHAVLPADYGEITAEVGGDASVVARIRAGLGIDPSATIPDGDVRQKLIGLKRAQETNTGLVAAVMANTFPRGFRAFDVDPSGLVHNVGNKPIAMGTILETADAPRVLNLNPEQAALWTTTHEIAGGGHESDINIMRKIHGLKPISPRELKEGELHFHREPLTKDGKRMPRPADPTEARLWDTQEAAIASAQPINYADPATNIAMQLKATLDEIHQHAFELDIYASGLGVNKAMLTTETGRVAHGKLRATSLDLRRKKDALNAALKESPLEELDPLTGGMMPSAVSPELAGMQTAVTEAADAQNAALTEMNQILARKHTMLPGTAVGKDTEELVPVRQFRGVDGRGKAVYIPAEESSALEQWFSRVGVKGPTFTGLAGTTQEIGDALRLFSATGDVAAPFVQGLPLLARDPVAWAKMAAKSYQSLFDPNVQANYIKNNFADIVDMVTKGRVPIGSSEAFAALQSGAGLGETLLTGFGRTNKVLNVVNRFQASYDTTLLVSRAEHWKSMRSGFGGTEEQLGQVVRNMTAGLETAGLGVGPTQRGIESMLFFAPKMLRSTLALFGQAARPWTPGGEVAAHTLMRMMAAGAGSMVLANVAIGMSNGETEEQIDKRIVDALDPGKGRQFLSMKVGDQWYGMGGQVRSATQMVYRGITSPDKMADLSRDNPLINFAMGRLSPITSLGLAGLELGTEENLDLLPFQTVDDFPDIVQLAGISALPFVAQNLIQNGGNVVPAMFELFGVRTSTITPTDALDAAAQKQFGSSYRDLTGREQTSIKEKNPDAVAAQEKLGNKAQLEYRATSKKNDQRVNDLLVVQSALVKEGKLDRTQFASNVSDMLHDRSLRNEAARQALGIDIVGADSPKRQVSDAHFATFRDAGYTPDGGQVDWNKWDALQANLQIDIKAGKYGDASRAQQYLDERVKFEPPPEAKWFFDNKKIITDSGYYDQREIAFADLRPMVNSMGYAFQSEADLEQAVLQAVNTGAPNARQLIRLRNLIGTRNEALHTKMRRADPVLRRALVENGVVDQQRQNLAEGIQQT